MAWLNRRCLTSMPVFGEKLRDEFIIRLRENRPLGHIRFNKKKVPDKGNSAVLVPLLNIRSEPWMLFTQRSLFLTGYRGQVCFPGGRLNWNEAPEQGALRESAEEIGLDPKRIEIWGNLRPVYTRNLLSIVTPVVGLLRDADLTMLQVQSNEVRSVFAVPIKEICSCNMYTHFKRPDGIRYILPVFISRHFQIISSNEPSPEEYRIWGLTAGILHLALLHLFPSFYSSNITILHPLEESERRDSDECLS